MAKKQIVRLTEGDLHKIIKESVYDVINHHYPERKLKNKSNDREAYKSLLSYHRYCNCVKDLTQKLIHHLDGFHYDDYNHRVSRDYIKRLVDNVKEIEKAFDIDSPLMTAQANQDYNPWKQKPSEFSPKRKRVYEPRYVNNNSEEEPEDWYERNEHGDFDTY